VITVSLKLADPCPQVAVLLPLTEETVLSVSPSTNVDHATYLANTINACISIPELVDDATLRWIKLQPTPIGVLAVGSTIVPNDSVSFSFTIRSPLVRIPLGIPANRSQPPAITEISIAGTHMGFVGSTESTADTLLMSPSVRFCTYNKNTRPHHDMVERSGPRHIISRSGDDVKSCRLQ